MARQKRRWLGAGIVELVGVVLVAWVVFGGLRTDRGSARSADGERGTRTAGAAGQLAGFSHDAAPSWLPPRDRKQRARFAEDRLEAAARGLTRWLGDRFGPPR